MTGPNEMSAMLPRTPVWSRMPAVGLVAILVIACPTAALSQTQEMPPIPTPFPNPEFHFSDPARDAEYWRLQRETERTLAIFRESVFAAYRALPSQPAQPGTPSWLQAKAAVERAIVARRPARDALDALINFITRERLRVPPSEVEDAFDICRVHEDSLRATAESLVNLLALLAGIRTGQWPA